MGTNIRCFENTLDHNHRIHCRVSFGIQITYTYPWLPRKEPRRFANETYDQIEYPDVLSGSFAL